MRKHPPFKVYIETLGDLVFKALCLFQEGWSSYKKEKNVFHEGVKDPANKGGNIFALGGMMNENW